MLVCYTYGWSLYIKTASPSCHVCIAPIVLQLVTVYYYIAAIASSSSPSVCTPAIVLQLVTLYGQPQLSCLHSSYSATVGYTIWPAPALLSAHLLVLQCYIWLHYIASPSSPVCTAPTVLHLVTLYGQPQLPICLHTSYSATAGYTIWPTPVPLPSAYIQ